MIFDLTNLEYWEHLLVAEPWHLYSKQLSPNEKQNAKALKHFAMPPSWVPQLKISEQSKNYVHFSCTNYDKVDNLLLTSILLQITFKNIQTIEKLFYTRKQKLKSFPKISTTMALFYG